MFLVSNYPHSYFEANKIYLYLTQSLENNLKERTTLRDQGSWKNIYISGFNSQQTYD